MLASTAFHPKEEHDSWARNHGQSMDNVGLIEDLTGQLLSCPCVDWSHLILFKVKQIKLPMLFNCYQCVASHCVLQNFDLQSWVKIQLESLITMGALKQTSGFPHF